MLQHVHPVARLQNLESFPVNARPQVQPIVQLPAWERHAVAEALLSKLPIELKVPDMAFGGSTIPGGIILRNLVPGATERQVILNAFDIFIIITITNVIIVLITCYFC